MTDETQAQSPEQTAQEESAAFAAGFNQQRGVEPSQPAAPAQAAAAEKPATTAAPKEETASPAADKASDAKDSPASEPPPWKAEIDAVRQTLADDIGKQLRAINGHIGNLTSQTKELRSALTQARADTEAKGAETPTQQQVDAALKDPARMKALKDDFPEFAEALEVELGDVRAQLAKLSKAAPSFDASSIKTEINGDVDKRIAQAKAEARASAYLDIKHEGWESLIATKDFEDWYAKQPKEVQALSASDKPQDASKMLDLFAAHRNKAAEQVERQKRLDRAVTPAGVAVTASHEDEDAAFTAGFKEARGG